jgi:hypothetical protein
LWRLRCATTIETGLYDTQADHLNELGDCNPVQLASRQSIYALFERRTLSSADEVFTSAESFAKRTVDFARCFLRLSNLPNYAFDRLSRYETALWCQVGQTLFALDPWIAANHKNEGRLLGIGNQQESQAFISPERPATVGDLGDLR